MKFTRLVRSEDNKALQDRLEALGYSVGADGPDGIYGRDTQSALDRYAAYHGWAPGIVPVEGGRLYQSLFPEHKTTIKDEITAVVVDRIVKGTGMLNFLTGYKTYIAGTVMILVGAASLIVNVTHVEVAGLGAMTIGEAWQSMSVGFGMIFIRKAIGG